MRLLRVQSLDNNTQAFLALVRAGLWEQDIQLLPNQDIEWQEVYRLATEQSVLGLVLAGLEHSDVKPPKELLLQWIGEVQQIEQRNKAMNKFVAELIDSLRKEDIYCLLVKGQGIAQCYERPLWRASGDIDLLLNGSNFYRAKDFYNSMTGVPSAVSNKNEIRKHLEYIIDSWLVELHGTLHTNLSKGIDSEIDNIQEGVFANNDVREWRNEDTSIFIPSPNNDIIFVFSHILQHFFNGGIGLRQISDLSRLLWTFRDSIDSKLLEQRLLKMGLVTEWKAFGNMMVNTLGLPVESLPIFDTKYKKKGDYILSYVLATGNFGHNKDYSYFSKYPILVRKSITLWRYVKDSNRIWRIFPIDSIKFLLRFMVDGIKSLIKG